MEMRFGMIGFLLSLRLARRREANCEGAAERYLSGDEGEEGG